MSDDRELLQLAALAAGIKGQYAGLEDFPDWMRVHDGAGIYCTDSDAWNPLTDDGDAFRLAVKLKIDLIRDFDRIDAVYGNGDGLVSEYLYELPTPTDPYAATRRAIVRAAAATGRQIGGNDAE